MGSGVTKWMIEGADIINYISYMRFEMSTRTIRLKRVIMLPLGYPTSPSTSSMSHSVMIRSYESRRPLQQMKVVLESDSGLQKDLAHSDVKLSLVTQARSTNIQFGSFDTRFLKRRTWLGLDESKDHCNRRRHRCLIDQLD